MTADEIGAAVKPKAKHRLEKSSGMLWKMESHWSRHMLSAILCGRCQGAPYPHLLLHLSLSLALQWCNPRFLLIRTRILCEDQNVCNYT